MAKRKKRVKIKLVTAREAEKEELKEETLLQLSERLKEAAQDKAYIKKLSDEIEFLKGKLRDSYELNKQLRKKTNVFELNVIDQLEKLKRQNASFIKKIQDSEKLKEALKKLRHVAIREFEEIKLLKEKLREKRKFNEFIEGDIKKFKSGVYEEIKELKRKNKIILLLKKELLDKSKLILRLNSEIRDLRKKSGKEKIIEVNKSSGLEILEKEAINKLKNKLEEKDRIIADFKTKLNLVKEKIEQSKHTSAKKELVAELTIVDKLKKDLAKKDKELALVVKHAELTKRALNEKKYVVENLKKDIVVLKEELAATKKINKGFLLKISKLREQERNFENRMKEKEMSIERKESFSKIFLDKEIKGKISDVIKKATLKEVQLKTEIEGLKKVVAGLKKELKEKEIKEKGLVEEFNKKFKELFSPIKMPKKKPLAVYEEGVVEKKGTDEILPMVDIALQHNEPVEKIKESLVNVGYDEEEIESVIRKIKS